MLTECFGNPPSLTIGAVYAALTGLQNAYGYCWRWAVSSSIAC